MNDAGSPLFGSSKGRERGSSAFSLLRGRRSGEADALISFNLLPRESGDPVPGRVSETRLLLVEYWRRDQRAAAAAAARDITDTAAALPAELPASGMFVNGAPVTPPTSVSTEAPFTGQPVFAAPSPTPAPAAAEPRPTQAAYADPNRQDFLSSLQAKSRSYQSRPDASGAESGSLIIESPSSSSLQGTESKGTQPASTLWGGDESAPAKAPDRAKSLFEPRARETASRVEPESVFAKAAAAMPPLPTPLPIEEITEASELATPEPQQPGVRALEAFLRRVEARRQQIESESVA